MKRFPGFYSLIMSIICWSFFKPFKVPALLLLTSLAPMGLELSIVAMSAASAWKTCVTQLRAVYGSLPDYTHLSLTGIVASSNGCSNDLGKKECVSQLCMVFTRPHPSFTDWTLRNLHSKYVNRRTSARIVLLVAVHSLLSLMGNCCNLTLWSELVSEQKNVCEDCFVIWQTI